MLPRKLRKVPPSKDYKTSAAALFNNDEMMSYITYRINGLREFKTKDRKKFLCKEIESKRKYCFIF